MPGTSRTSDESAGVGTMPRSSRDASAENMGTVVKALPLMTDVRISKPLNDGITKWGMRRRGSGYRGKEFLLFGSRLFPILQFLFVDHLIRDTEIDVRFHLIE